jgi:hypothetical protein
MSAAVRDHAVRDHAARDRTVIVAAEIIETIADALRRWNASGDLAGLTDAHAAVVAILRAEFHDSHKDDRLSDTPSRSTRLYQDGETKHEGK